MDELVEISVSRIPNDAPERENILIWENFYDGEEPVCFVGYRDSGGIWRYSPEGTECAGTVFAWARTPGLQPHLGS